MKKVLLQNTYRRPACAYSLRFTCFGAIVRWPLGLLACLLVLSLSACGSVGATGPGASPPTATTAPTTVVSGISGDFVGTVPDLLAGIAISTDGQNVLVYISDGTPSHITHALWFQGQLSSNTFTLNNIATIEVAGLLSSSGVTGTVTLADGSNHTFSASPVASGSQAGLYRSELTVSGVNYLGGWYVLNPGASTSEAPLEGGGVLDEGTNMPLTSPTPDFAQKSVMVSGIGTFTLHYCHLAQCR